MRIFGRVTNYLKISRCLSYHAPLFRPRSLTYTERFRHLCISASSVSKTTPQADRTSHAGRLRVQKYSQKGNSVFSISDNVDMLRKRISFSGSSGNAPKILPIGLITPETGDGKELKIVIVPLDLSGMDANALKDTLETINQLRLYANHIETFSSSMVEEYGALNEAIQEIESQAQSEELKAESNTDDRNFWESLPSSPAADVNAVGTAMDAGMGAGTNMPLQRQAAVSSCLQSSLGNPVRPAATNASLKTTKSMSALAQPEPIQENSQEASLKELSTQEGDFVEEVRVDVPQDLSNRLNEMAVSSMELSFEMDMTNLRDALNSKDSNTVASQDPMICMHTKVELDATGGAVETLPLRFNALISGVVEIDAMKLKDAQLTEDKMPGFNDDLTSLAANLCSTALEKGFASNSKSSDETYIADLELTKDEEAFPTRIIDTSFMSSAAQIGHQREALQKIAEKASTVPGTQEVEIPVPVDKDGCKHPPVKPKRKCPGKCPLITDPCKDDPCERPEKKKAPKKKAEQTTEITSKAKGGDKKDSCAKGGKGKDKKDPCAQFKKGGKDGKKDGCDKDKKKKDPCAKFKSGEKKDPCAKKDDKKKDPCAKKKDPCAKKDDKKKDPCAKKKDPCAKKDDKKKDPCGKKDPCAKKDDKKKDPCAKKDDKKKDPCAKKKDPCAKKKDPCAKKKDPCAKKDDKKKDPCAKKKDPCAKKDEKKDPCAKKKDPCAKFKKGGKDGKDKCKFSTFSRRPDPSKRYLSTGLSHVFQESAPVPKAPRFQVYSTLVRRHYRVPVPKTTSCCQCSLCKGHLLDRATPPARFTINTTLLRRRFGGLVGKITPGCLSQFGHRGYAKKSKKGGKCGQMATKYPKSRGKDIKERTGLREDCFSDDDGGCGVKSCTGKCAKVKFPKKKCERKEKKDDGRIDNLLARNSFVQLQTQRRSLSTRVCCHPSPKPKSGERRSVDDQAYALRISNSYEVKVVPASKPRPKDFDVLIRTGSVAVSNSDIHVYENGSRDIEAMSLGHDATGIVEEVGRCVHHLHAGDRVVMESALSCGICDLCKQGQYNMCSGLVYNGFLSTYQTHPADLCHRLPPSISMEEGALTQTLALGCQACFKGNITPTSNVLILGSCPTAVAAGICANAIGAKRVAIAGCMAPALDVVAKDFGFQAVEFDSNALFGEVLEAIYSKFKDWPDCVINCSISAMTMNLAVMALQPCGVCVLAECDSECASFNALDVLMKNIRLVPSFRSANMYPTAIQLMRSGRAPMHKFIAATYPLSKAEEAFRAAQHESNIGLGKIIVNCADEVDIEENLGRRPKSAS
ncbi:uncharacterized protein LOC108031777 isoform X2 [Drosophila biarmipes]|uniref:uncharacterized protein LOC108031777 isoform X2 n=1 Tax=Drosophila biarmipes TaxID=125945 RepID=UPI0007E5C794|nr:uncharacterized protein LOC108031777 isoform X2 [Drosophila biarmipes]